MFINCSNHNSSKWSEKQLKAASRWGAIVDIPFPSVDPNWDSYRIEELARGIVEEIMVYKPEVVMCQGEFNMSYAIVGMLRSLDVIVVAACSARNVEESFMDDGAVRKQSDFQFVRFREYI